jgi:hypothetical protein
MLETRKEIPVMRLRPVLFSLALAGAACAVTSAAIAGSAAIYNVSVSPYGATNGHIVGSLGAARYSSDGTQYIGCRTYGGPGSTVGMACQATDASGSTRLCSSNDATLIALASRVNPTSLLWVYFTGGTCTYLEVDNSSEVLH